jgi:hypothetical protein
VGEPVPDPDPRPGAGRARRVLVLLGIVGTGTAGALGADLLLGPADGWPALHLLVVLALPFWDALPARLGPRLLVLVAVLAAVAAAWVAIAGLRPEEWWRAEVSLGLACAAVGVGQVAVAGRGHVGRTVER